MQFQIDNTRMTANNEFFVFKRFQNDVVTIIFTCTPMIFIFLVEGSYNNHTLNFIQFAKESLKQDCN